MPSLDRSSINAWSVGLLDFPTPVLLERVQYAEDLTAEALAGGLDRSLSALGSDARRHRIMRVLVAQPYVEELGALVRAQRIGERARPRQ